MNKNLKMFALSFAIAIVMTVVKIPFGSYAEGAPGVIGATGPTKMTFLFVPFITSGYLSPIHAGFYVFALNFIVAFMLTYAVFRRKWD